jgi:hypothetical protein
LLASVGRSTSADAAATVARMFLEATDVNDDDRNVGRLCTSSAAEVAFSQKASAF